MIGSRVIAARNRAIRVIEILVIATREDPTRGTSVMHVSLATLLFRGASVPTHDVEPELATAVPLRRRWNVIAGTAIVTAVGSADPCRVVGSHRRPALREVCLRRPHGQANFPLRLRLLVEEWPAE